MNEPVHQWTKTAKTAISINHEDTGEEAIFACTAMIILDIRTTGEFKEFMYEGHIEGFVEFENWFKDSREYSDSQTFETEREAQQFINDCLDEWGFDHTFLSQDLLRNRFYQDRRKNQ